MFEVFLLLGLTIVLGWLSVYISKKWHVSQIIPLMIFGFLIGPVFNLIDIGENSVIRGIYPFMSVLALIVLLFDAGISFKTHNILKTINKTSLFTMAVFLLTILFSLVLMSAGFGFLESVIVGCTLAGVSSAIVVSIVEPMRVSDETISFLTLESVINDVLVIIGVFVLIQIYNAESLSASSVMNDLISSFTIAIVFGAVAAYFWYRLLDKMPTFGFDYMLTLAALFILYSANEAVGSSGGLSVFVFAMVFANLKQLPEYFASKRRPMEEKKIRTIQYEITFFVRTFFFVYIGMLYPLFKFDLTYFLISFALVGLYILARYIGFRFILFKDKRYDNIIIFVLPRGLAAAVMVGVVVNSGIVIPGFEIMAFTVIFLTNIVSTIAIFLKEKDIEKKLSLRRDLNP